MPRRRQRRNVTRKPSNEGRARIPHLAALLWYKGSRADAIGTLYAWINGKGTLEGSKTCTVSSASRTEDEKTRWPHDPPHTVACAPTLGFPVGIDTSPVVLF